MEELHGLARSLLEGARFAEAAEVFCVLRTEAPQEPEFAFGFAESLRMAGDYEAALPRYTDACLLDPLDPRPLLGRSECLMALGRESEAQLGFDRLRQLCELTRSDELRAWLEQWPGFATKPEWDREGNEA